MKDEEIIAEFKNFYGNPIPDETLFLACDIATRYPGNYDMAKHEAYGFISGCKTTERLAKIEVLENLINDVGFDIGGLAYNNIRTQITELKAGNQCAKP